MINLPLRKIYQAWFAVSCFYLYQYVLRAFPNIMSAEMRPSLAMTASEYGFLGAINLYAYAFLQIPLGVLLDKYGVRKIVITGIIVCLLGVSLMLNNQNQNLAYFSRFLIGIGSSCGFMSAIKILTDHVPEGKKGFLIGSTLTIGTVGAAISSNLIIIFFTKYSWHNTIFLLLAGGAIILFNCFKNIPSSEANNKLTNKIELKSLVEVITNKNILYYGIASIALYTPFSVIADIWGSDFLQKKINLSNKSASMISMLMYIGLGAGSIVIPYFTERHKITDKVILICTILIGICLALLIYAPIENIKLIFFTVIVLGFFCSAEMVCFAGLSNYVNKNNSGAAIGVVNSLNMFFAGASQHFVGWLLDFNWSGEVNDKLLRIYSLANFKFALTSLLIMLGICLIVTLKRFYQDNENS